MVKDHVFSNCGQNKGARIIIFTHMMQYIFRNIVSYLLAKLRVFFTVFRNNFLFPTLFAPSLICSIYGGVCTSQNGADKAQT